MSIFDKFFKRTQDSDESQVAVEASIESVQEKDNDEWEELPAFIETDASEYELVSLIATAIATGDQPESQFVVKKIMQRNPEAQLVSVIAASLAAGSNEESQLSIRKLSKRK
ncbi:hypothetical protein JZO70_03230 [Enterococcus sp. 669A]|uniref:Uncharacterized protein n=1 Tax=Candidatus Enterococcus moelleringii TaxID=2815325 RepID=A0ABS3L6B0_9ENTE|nr:hypothetical protein [Enterococcus sp. 669A]